MKKKKDELAKKFAEEMQLPQSAVSDIFRIEMRGKSDVMIEGCKGIVEYDENTISLNLGNCIVSLTGNDLEINNLSEQQAIINGNVCSVNFT